MRDRIEDKTPIVPGPGAYIIENKPKHRKKLSPSSKLLICNMTAPSIPSNPTIVAQDNKAEEVIDEFNPNNITVPPNNKLTKSKLLMNH